ncbi:unnamed protein product [Arctia plantaginis]|uniref:Uncharacterized protein n=1 Tax=Arctia plantaginis TaxID=874455 RepID=A0A8S1AIB4_ARCPL|nr:unnamed protein product [Arctia plantaginis]
MWANLSEETESSDIVVELNKLHQRIEEMKNRRVEVEDSLSTHDVHLYSVSYILVGAGVVAVGALWCRRWQRMRARSARISPDIELQPTVRSGVVSSAWVADRQPSVQAISESARHDMGHRRPNSDHIYGEINKCAVKDQSCSPMPRKHFELRP